MENKSITRCEFISFDEYLNDILEKIDGRPKEWRKGQFVFNYINMKYGEVARDVQFIDKIDCFYRDECIEDFIVAVWQRLR